VAALSRAAHALIIVLSADITGKENASKVIKYMAAFARLAVLTSVNGVAKIILSMAGCSSFVRNVNQYTQRNMTGQPV